MASCPQCGGPLTLIAAIEDTLANLSLFFNALLTRLPRKPVLILVLFKGSLPHSRQQPEHKKE